MYVDPDAEWIKKKAKSFRSSLIDYKYHLKFQWELGKLDPSGTWKKLFASALWDLVKIIANCILLYFFIKYIWVNRHLWGFN